jgi:hypothetical protein
MGSEDDTTSPAEPALLCLLRAPAPSGARGEGQAAAIDHTMRGGSDARGEDSAVSDPCDGVGCRHRTPRLRSAATCAARRGGWHPHYQQAC